MPAALARGLSFPRTATLKVPARMILALSCGPFLPDSSPHFGVPIIAGRDFNELDGKKDTEPVVIVSETLAKRMFPNQDAINRQSIGRIR